MKKSSTGSALSFLAKLATPALFGTLLLGAGLGTPALLAVDIDDTRLLANPALSQQHVAFTYASDLWIADREGGAARRLTNHVGDEHSPRFSPDGKWLAFTGEYDGNSDVYLVDVRGGAPVRLTWHPDADVVQDFSPDGTKILFASQRQVFTRRYVQLFEVSVPEPNKPSKASTGLPTRLPIPNGYRASYNGDGSKIAYLPNTEAFDQWKNYRGGTTARIWIYDTRDHSVVQVPQPEGRSNDTDPVFVGDAVWFRSDRDGEFNLYSWTPDNYADATRVARHTDFEDFPILKLSGSDDTLIFEQAGYLHLFDPGSGQPERLRISAIDDLGETRATWAEGSEWVREADLSPDGKRAAFEYRGEIVTLPAKKGDLHNLSNSTDAHDRSPSWSPDGSQIAWFSDATDEYRLYIAPTSASGEELTKQTRSYEPKGNGFYEGLSWSPDGKHVTYTDNSWTLFILNLDTGNVTEVATEPYFGPGQFRALDSDWSPDSKWLAYSQSSDAAIESVFLYNLESGSSTQVTDGLSNVGKPVFDRGGKYLYMMASTDAGPVKDWFAQSNADMESSSAIYLAVLSADTESPLKAENDTVEVTEAKDDEAAREDESDGESDGDKDDEKTEKPEVQIDFAGLDQRIIALPLPEAEYQQLEAGEEGKLYYLNSDHLGVYDLGERKDTTLLEGANSFALSATGKHLLYVAGPKWGIAAAGAPIDTAETALPLDKLRVRVDPPAEWQQIYREVWRINRDYFYDPGMHGADWTAMGEKYAQFLPHLTSRGDLNRVLMWMCSELAVGHHRVGGGEDPSEAEQTPVGLLGADYEIDRSVTPGRYRISKIFGGLNWNPDLRSPLTEPGVAIGEGDYLMAVDGVALTANDNLFARFEHTADTIVELTVANSADGKGARTVHVTPIGSESALRNRDWVEGNLKKVTEATDGRVAYVYVPNTAGQGHQYFKRYFYPQADRQAIIVDERFNGGGQVADYYIDLLRRPQTAWWATRYGKDIRSPAAAILGPKVMIIDETAGSGGDLLPYMFRNLELGTLVGKRTWGGLVGTLGFPILIDGGFVTAPNLAIWSEDGFVVENVGVPPDVEVEQWPVDVIAGRDPQLEKAIELALEELEANPPKVPTRPAFPIRVRQ